MVRVAYDRNEENDNGWDDVKTIIDAAIAEGIYVIIDWHFTPPTISRLQQLIFHRQAKYIKIRPM